MKNILVAASLAVTLAGCAMTQAQRAGLDPAKTVVPPGQGLVIARLVTNTTSAPIVLGNATLSVREVKGDKSYGYGYVLENKAVPGATSALFFQALPPGHYQPIELVSGAGGITLTAPLEKLSKGFEVEADRVTDLGALVMVFESVGAFAGKYGMAHLASPDDSAAALKALPQDLSQRLTAQPPLRAGGSADSTANNLALREALSRASITSSSPLIEGKPMLFGRTLGLVSLWDPERQQWMHMHTGRSFAARATAISNDGTLLVGMDQGVMLARSGPEWEVLPPPARNASILFIGQSVHGEYFVVAEDHSAFVVLSSETLAGPWNELQRFAAGRFLNPSHNSRAQVALTPSRLAVIFSPGGTSRAVLHTFDLATRQWESTELADTGYAIPADGQLVTSGGTAFNPAMQWSTDWGKSFKRIPLENWSILPAFRDEQTIYVRRLEKMGLVSANESITMLSRSRDGGATWEQMGELPKFMTQLYVMPRPGWLLATTMIGDLHVSSDDGRTWKRQPPAVASSAP
jgi:hypothetical protein